MLAPNDNRSTRLRPARIALALLIIEAVAVARALLWGGYAGVSTEERSNAQAAAHLACGHLDRVLELRYRPSCGGCTAASGALLAGRIAGPRAALASSPWSSAHPPPGAPSR